MRKTFSVTQRPRKRLVASVTYPPIRIYDLGHNRIVAFDGTYAISFAHI
jgi:hypothetical protein